MGQLYWHVRAHGQCATVVVGDYAMSSGLRAGSMFGGFVIAQLKVCACQPWSKDDRGDQCCPRLEKIDGVGPVAHRSGVVRRTLFWPDRRVG